MEKNKKIILVCIAIIIIVFAIIVIIGNCIFDMSQKENTRSN